MFGASLLIVGCVLTAVAVWMFRRNAADWRRFWGAVRVTGEVLDVARGPSGTARVRVRFRLRGQTHMAVLSAWWNAEDAAWYLGGSGLGDRVRLLVPPARPGDAAATGDVKSLVVMPGGLGLIGSGAVGFGLLFLTESLAVAGPVLTAGWVGGVGLFAYFFFSRRDTAPGTSSTDG